MSNKRANANGPNMFALNIFEMRVALSPIPSPIKCLVLLDMTKVLLRLKPKTDERYLANCYSDDRKANGKKEYSE